MIVYRICKENEINSIMKNHSFHEIGILRSNNSKINSHSYEMGKKYMHFFENYDSVFYLNVSKGTYICTYSIPDELLVKYMGFGYYLDRIHFDQKESVIEYAIPNDEIDFGYLQRVDQVTQYIDFEDYLDDFYQGSLKTVYDIHNHIKCKKLGTNMDSNKSSV